MGICLSMRIIISNAVRTLFLSSVFEMAASGDAESEKVGGVGKFCRACTDFKTWMKQQRKPNETHKESTSENQPSKESLPQREDCPLDTTELGRNTWSFLHTMAAYYPEKPSNNQQDEMKQFFTIFSKFYPCDTCAEDMRKKMSKLPPRVSSQHDLSQWLCKLHNEINKSLGKPEFNCAFVNERWRDGWKDGSCD